LEPHGRLAARRQCPATQHEPSDRSGVEGSHRGSIGWRGKAENLDDLSVDEVIEQFDVTREQVEAVLEFVAESLRSEVPTGARPV
jgi:hypothetical protein